MVVGFMVCRSLNKILDALSQTEVKNLTLISSYIVFVDKGVGKLITNKQKNTCISHKVKSRNRKL